MLYTGLVIIIAMNFIESFQVLLYSDVDHLLVCMPLYVQPSAKFNPECLHALAHDVRASLSLSSPR
jgi:hypothetical protein